MIGVVRAYLFLFLSSCILSSCTYFFLFPLPLLFPAILSVLLFAPPVSCTLTVVYRYTRYCPRGQKQARFARPFFLAVLGLQFSCWDDPLRFQVLRPQHGTAVLRGSTSAKRRLYMVIYSSMLNTPACTTAVCTPSPTIEQAYYCRSWILNLLHVLGGDHQLPPRTPPKNGVPGVEVSTPLRAGVVPGEYRFRGPAFVPDSLEL